MIQYFPIVTGSLTVNGDLIVTGTGSMSASLALNSNLLQGTGSTGFATTASLLAVSSSQQQISASLLTLTASYTALSSSYTALSGSYNTFSGSESTRITKIENNYATTGSNSFRADQSITGSLVVSSTITAQTLVVQTITSSVSYITGSTRFGSLLTNTHTFTGSLNVTGSTHTIYGAIGIGTAANAGVGMYLMAPSSGNQTLSVFDFAKTRGITFYPSYTGQANTHLITSDYAGASYYNLALSARTNGTDLFISSSGNIGIGTTNPSQKLEVVGGEIKAGRVDSSQEGGQVSFGRALDNNTSWYIDLYGSAASPQLRFVNVDNSVVAMTITGSNVGIGLSNPTDTDGYGGRVLDVNGPGYFRDNSDNTKYVSIGSVSSIGFIEANGTGNYLRFYTGGTGEKMRITSGGDLLVNTTSVGAGSVTAAKSAFVGPYISDSNTTTLSTQRTSGFFTIDAGASSNNQGSSCAIVAQASWGASSNPGAIFRGYGSSTLNVQINYNGNITNTNNSYGAISDISLKENIVDATPKLNDLLNVKIRNYNLKADSIKIKQIGVVAQELEEVFPNMVETDTEGLKSVKYSVFVPMLVKAIQELKAEFDTYKETHP